MSSKVIHVRMNDEEIEILKELKELLNIPEDSAAIKAAVSCSLNVTQRLFGGNLAGIFHIKSAPLKPRFKQKLPFFTEL